MGQPLNSPCTIWAGASDSGPSGGGQGRHCARDLLPPCASMQGTLCSCPCPSSSSSTTGTAAWPAPGWCCGEWAGQRHPQHILRLGATQGEPWVGGVIPGAVLGWACGRPGFHGGSVSSAKANKQWDQAFRVSALGMPGALGMARDILGAQAWPKE